MILSVENETVKKRLEDMAAKGNEYRELVREEMEKINQDEMERYLYLRREMAVSDKVSQLKSAKNIGRRENAIEIVKMLFRNGASFELVQKSVLELPEEEIRKIYEEICLTEDEK